MGRIVKKSAQEKNRALNLFFRSLNLKKFKSKLMKLVHFHVFD